MLFVSETVSETWLNKDKGFDVGIEGYELFTLDRTYTKAGGVAIYVDQSLRCSTVPSMTTTRDGIMECLTIEIDLAESKNVIISCVYRTPGSCLDIFNQELDNMFGNTNNKIHMLVGTSMWTY